MSFADITYMNYTVHTSYAVPDWVAALVVGSFFAASILWIILMIVANWKIFEKADESGWKSIIPFYNVFTYFRISGHSGWLMFLLFIPIVNLILSILVVLDFARNFGKGLLFTIFWLIIFAPIGHLILGYGSAEFVGEKHE